MTVESEKAGSEVQSNDVASEQASELDDTNLALKCVLQNDVEYLQACFEDRENEEDPLADKMPDIIKERGDGGKSPLDMAVVLGRVEVAKELVARGVDVNEVTACQGYGPLHFAAAWGRIDCLKLLIENGCDLHLRTSSQERGREIALRFNQTECVDYLDWAEAKQDLHATVSLMKETLNDPEKIQGRLSRDEKNSTLALCNEKLDWIENTTDATTENFITQKQEFDKAVAEINEKLEAPLPEKPEKK